MNVERALLPVEFDDLERFAEKWVLERAACMKAERTMIQMHPMM